MMTFGASLCAASVKVLPESATPDVQCVFAPASYKPGLIRKLDDRPGITGGPWQMRPLSRGYVLAQSPDPRQQPAINPRYLSDTTDQRAMVGGLKFLLIFGGRRLCTLSIHWPGRSASAARFSGRQSHFVSKRPIWLAEAAEPMVARSPTTQRIAGSRHSLSASFTSS
jgi:hypothetical protein